MKKWLLMSILTLFVWVTVTPVHAYEATGGPTGLIRYKKGDAYEGYTLFSPMMSNTSYLIDMEGNVVHKWDTNYRPGLYAELLPNGNLLRGGRLDDPPVKFGGRSGLVQEIDWNGKVVWQYKNHSPKSVHHHTFCRLPNGNTLVLSWEYKTYEEAIAKGRDPYTLPKEGYEFAGTVHKGIWPDYLEEVNPAGQVVWTWHAWDHVGTGPNQLDINFCLPKAAKYMANADWNHMNSIAYIPETDQIVLNSRNFGEFYLINHKTGAIENRWGNPSAYKAGRGPSWIDDGDQQLFGPHDVSVLKNGNFLIFDNGWKRPEGMRSRVVELDLKKNKIVWQYATNVTNSFYSAFQGGAQRLPNGNTLICSTGQGHIFEVTGGSRPQVVWEYIVPVVGPGSTKCFIDDREDIVDASEEILKNIVHRAFRYGKDYPGLKGKDLSQRKKLTDCPEMWKLIKR